MFAILATAFGQDRYRVTHRLSDFGALENAQPLWSKAVQKTNASPVIAGDKIILLERLSREQERIRCFRLRDGETVWEHRYPAPLPHFFDAEFGWGPHATPVVQGRTVVTIGTTGVAWALDADTGRTLWHRDLWKEYPTSTPLERGFAASPVLEAGRLIIPVGGRGAGILAVEFRTGRTAWASTDFAAAYTSPLVGMLGGQRQIVVLMQDVLCGLDAVSGRLLWQVPFESPNTVHVASAMVVDDRHVLAGSSSGTRLFRVTRQESGWNVAQVWQTSRCAPQIGNFVRVNADQVIAPSSGGSGSLTTCLNLKDGSVAWKERFGGRGSVFRLLDGVMTLNDSGDLEGRSVTSSFTKPVFRLMGFGSSPQWSAPAFGEGVLILQRGDRLEAWRLGRS